MLVMARCMASDLLHLFLAHDTFHILIRRHTDNGRLEDRKRGRILIVVQHDVECANGVFAFEENIEAKQDKFGFPFHLVGNNAANRSWFITGTHLKVRAFVTNWIAVALHLFRALRRIARHRDIGIWNWDRWRWRRWCLAYIGKGNRDPIATLMNHRQKIDSYGNAHYFTFEFLFLAYYSMAN